MSREIVLTNKEAMRKTDSRCGITAMQVIPLVFLSMFLFSSVSAQSYFFKVLGIKGACKADNQPLKVGSNIQAYQVIIVPPHGYLGLAHYSGRTIEIKHPGSYKAKELEAKLKASYSIDMQRYFDMVVSELTLEADIFARRERLRKAKTFTGKAAVTRKLANQAIEFVLPQTSLVFEDTILLRWFVADSSYMTEKPIYEVKIFSMLDELLYQTQTPDNQIAINLKDAQLRKEQKAYWYSVNLLANPDVSSGEPQSFNKLSPVESEKVRREIEILPDDGSVIGQLILARYLEDKGLLANALFVYERALQGNTIEQFQEIYQDFLIRNNMLPEVKGK